jgi:hypothetical protein
MINQDQESITLFTEQEWRAIERESALRFLPRAISQTGAGAGK